MSNALNVLNDAKAAPLVLDPRTYARALSCVHCGLCLPACPTYTETGHEADSPRGRIQLMRGLADGTIAPSASVHRHLDLCLDCRACETACPSDVVYHELIEETRARFAEQSPPTLRGRFLRLMFSQILTRPTRLKLALLPVRLLQKIGLYGLIRRSGLFKLLPRTLRRLERMLPDDGPFWPRRLPAVTQSGNNVASSHRVGFFSGCIGGVMFGGVNQKAVDLLAAGGAEVVAPRGEVCCGAIHHHNGARAEAQALARRNIDAFLPMAGGPSPDLIVTAIAGCGAMLREYDVLLRDDPAYAERAKTFSERVRDVSEALLELGLPEMRGHVDAVVTYHDACHLAHAQGVAAAPRELLARVSGLILVPLPESDMCCGAAGTYNLTEPEMAARLADRKLGHIASTGAGACVTGNAGCALHLSAQARDRGQPLRIVHPVELLHAAVFPGDNGTRPLE